MSDPTVYIPIQGNAETADRLSRGVYRISQPVGYRPEDYRTTHAFSWLIHPETGAVMLALDPVQTIPCHVAADPSELLTIIADETTAEERAMLVGVLRQFEGRAVPLQYLIPPQSMAKARTREQLEEEGWFATAVEGLGK